MTSILDLVIAWEAEHSKADAIIYHPDSKFPIEAVYYSPYKETNRLSHVPAPSNPKMGQDIQTPLSDEELNKILYPTNTKT